MFFKNYHRKELEQKIASEEKGVADYEKLLEDIKNNYLPLRDKSRKYGLDYYYKHKKEISDFTG